MEGRCLKRLGSLLWLWLSIPTFNADFALIKPEYHFSETGNKVKIQMLFGREIQLSSAQPARVPKSENSKRSYEIEKTLFWPKGSRTRTKRSAEQGARCGNGVIIPTRFFCNGRDDCGDNFDEQHCLFVCGDGRRIPGSWQCDGDRDCSDAIDEACFHCNNGRKIPASWQCDGSDDCGDKTDERHCFQCRDGKTIPRGKECDGAMDCADKSDEICFRCDLNKRNLIPLRLVCNARNDCPDKSDELHPICQKRNRLKARARRRKTLFETAILSGKKSSGNSETNQFAGSTTSSSSAPVSNLSVTTEPPLTTSTERERVRPKQRKKPQMKIRPRPTSPANGKARSRSRPAVNRPSRPAATRKKPSEDSEPPGIRGRGLAARGTPGSRKGVSKALRKFIVDWHNAARLKVAKGAIQGQPPASNMKWMRWDNAIARKAQLWTETCNYMHEQKSHCGVSGFHGLGENIGVSTINRAATRMTRRDFRKFIKFALDSMFSEHQYFTWGKTPSKCSREPCGHYVQMVWGETEAVGCGLSECRNIANWEPGATRRTLYISCKYGPSGNTFGFYPYNQGRTCSDCGFGNWTCRAGGLCDGGLNWEQCEDSKESCGEMKRRGATGPHWCWPCERWAASGVCSLCSSRFRQARQLCPHSCSLCSTDYLLNNKI